jgi:chemotaxis family two-component system response regulator Rcp1
MGGSGSNPNPDEDRPSESHSQSEEQTGQRRHILIVEDNSADVFLIRAAIDAANIHADLHIVKDGEQAVRFLDEADGDDAAPSPALVILDINLPRKQGGEVLQHLRKSRRCGTALVIAVSTSDSTQDREHMTRLGANAYFNKPSEYSDFMKLGDLVKELLRSGSRRA